MNKEEFISKLQSIIDLGDNFRVLVYFIMKTADGVCLKKADIKRDVLLDMRSEFLKSIQKEIDRFADTEHALHDLSSHDESNNVVYRYDLPDEEPSFFALMRDVYDSYAADDFTGARMFNFENDNLSDIDSFIIEAGATDNKLVIYRNNFNINLMRQGKGCFYINRSETQFDQVKEDILRMDSQIDVLMFGIGDEKHFFIINLSYLDNNKDFATVITRRATDALNRVGELNIVDSIEGMQKRLTEDTSFARRLMSAEKSSPVTAMNIKKVLDFVRNHKKLKNVLKIENNKITLSSKKAQDSFVRLLNDDFLHSKLTEKDYESKAKDPVR